MCCSSSGDDADEIPLDERTPEAKWILRLLRFVHKNGEPLLQLVCSRYKLNYDGSLSSIPKSLHEQVAHSLLFNPALPHQEDNLPHMLLHVNKVTHFEQVWKEDQDGIVRRVRISASLGGEPFSVELRACSNCGSAFSGRFMEAVQSHQRAGGWKEITDKISAGVHSWDSIRGWRMCVPCFVNWATKGTTSNTKRSSIQQVLQVSSHFRVVPRSSKKDRGPRDDTQGDHEDRSIDTYPGSTSRTSSCNSDVSMSVPERSTTKKRSVSDRIETTPAIDTPAPSPKRRPVPLQSPHDPFFLDASTPPEDAGRSGVEPEKEAAYRAIECLADDEWWEARILQDDGSSYLVHYVCAMGEEEEWIPHTSKRLRQANSSNAPQQPLQKSRTKSKVELYSQIHDALRTRLPRKHKADSQPIPFSSSEGGAHDGRALSENNDPLGTMEANLRLAKKRAPNKQKSSSCDYGQRETRGARAVECSSALERVRSVSSSPSSPPLPVSTALMSFACVEREDDLCSELQDEQMIETQVVCASFEIEGDGSDNPCGDADVDRRVQQVQIEMESDGQNLRYQWTCGGRPILGAKQKTLTLSANTCYRDEIAVIVSNEYGHALTTCPVRFPFTAASARAACDPRSRLYVLRCVCGAEREESASDLCAPCRQCGDACRGEVYSSCR